MSKRKQIVLSAALIIAAATVVGLYGFRRHGGARSRGGRR
jgi:hypothetical protein